MRQPPVSTYRNALGASGLTAIALATLALSVAHAVHAQTQEQAQWVRQGTNTTALEALAAEFQRQHQADEAAVARYLAANPGVAREVVKEGVPHRIVRIGSDGNPIYVKSRSGLEMPFSNVESGQLIKADSLYPGGSLGVDITGQSMTVGVWEPGVPRTTHELLTGKVTVQASQQGDTGIAAQNHATHVTGTIVGRGGLSGDGASARGLAYSASAHNWDASNDTAEMATAAAASLLVSNHSYGYANDNTVPEWQFGAYDSESRAWDVLTAAAPYYLPLVAGGNEQQNSGNMGKAGYDLMTGASASKNAMTVGAVNADKSMSAYSNWGPTDDGRVKPEVVARGTGINSAQATSDTAYSGSGSDSSGTSYATPAVSAAALLLQQYHASRHSGTYMRASTLKALLMGTAEDLGQPGPDHKFGYGLVNTEAAANAIKSNSTVTGTNCAAGTATGRNCLVSGADSRGALVYEWLANPTNNSSDEFTLAVTAKGNGTPLVVNLGWTDDAGTEQVAGDGTDPTTDRMAYDFDVLVRTPLNTFERAWVVPTLANRAADATKATANFQANGGPFRQVVIANATAGPHIIYLKKKTGSPATMRPLSLVVTGMAETLPNAAPVASNVAVTGTAQVGVQLSGSYTYADAESNPEGSSTFRWVRNSSPAVNVATTQSHTPVAGDVGYPLQFCVTPVASTGTTTGTEVCSAATAAVVAAPVHGACGSAAGVATAYLPTANLCATGTATGVTAGASSWAWGCSGAGGGSTASCAAPFASVGGGAVGAIRASGSNGWQIRTAESGFVAPPAPAPAGVVLPLGVAKVVLETGTAGTSAVVTLHFSSIPAGAQLYKYGKPNGVGDANSWFAYPATIDAAAGTVTYTLTDGQRGDNDWVANSVIDDPVALGVSATVVSVPTLSPWGLTALAGLMGVAMRMGRRFRAALPRGR